MKIALCVPKSISPTHDELYGLHYRAVPCPRCGDEMWLGERTEAVVKKGEAEMLCMICAVSGGLVDKDTKPELLSARDN